MNRYREFSAAHWAISVTWCVMKIWIRLKRLLSLYKLKCDRKDENEFCIYFTVFSLELLPVLPSFKACRSKCIGNRRYAQYDNLRHDLKKSPLAEYYWVHDLHDRNALKAACDHFIAKHGAIDRLESHNEYWLQTDAWLRGEYGIYGLKSNEIAKRQSKNSMKDILSSGSSCCGR